MKIQETLETKVQEVQEMNVLEIQKTKITVQIEKVVNLLLSKKRSHEYMWLFAFLKNSIKRN